MITVQGDSHVWNIFLPRAGGSNDVRIFDWDCWRAGVGTDDLAYMMALHWYADHRRRNEPLLLDHYRAELLARGVTGYDRHALDDDYRLSVLWQIATPVWQAANNIPAEFWWNNLERTFLAIDDLGVWGRVPLVPRSTRGDKMKESLEILSPSFLRPYEQRQPGDHYPHLDQYASSKGTSPAVGVMGLLTYSAIGSQRKPSPQRLM
jgi:hypothetical protein